MKQLFLSMLISMMVISMSAQSAFVYDDFSSLRGLSLVADASQCNGSSVLLTPSKSFKKGAMWFNADKMQVDHGFSTEFAFRYSRNRGTGHGADGIAFVI
ncbi:MAG: hypothetical protein AAF206_23370, partial [Bacteroidota bacterium]